MNPGQSNMAEQGIPKSPRRDFLSLDLETGSVPLALCFSAQLLPFRFLCVSPNAYQHT